MAPPHPENIFLCPALKQRNAAPCVPGENDEFGQSPTEHGFVPQYQIISAGVINKVDGQVCHRLGHVEVFLLSDKSDAPLPQCGIHISSS